MKRKHGNNEQGHDSVDRMEVDPKCASSSTSQGQSDSSSSNNNNSATSVKTRSRTNNAAPTLASTTTASSSTASNSTTSSNSSPAAMVTRSHSGHAHAQPKSSSKPKPTIKLPPIVRCTPDEKYIMNIDIDGGIFRGTIFNKHEANGICRKEEKEELNDFKVVVLGAGVSGLACAQELQQRGYKVTVLEGRDRVGGRVHSDEKFGCPVDLGAGWIHGVGEPQVRGYNPMYALCQRCSLHTYSTTSECPMFDEKVGRVDLEVDQDLERQFNELLTEAVDIGLQDKNGVGMSLEQGVFVAAKKRAFDDLQTRLLNWHCANIEGPSAAECGELSLLYWDQDDENAFQGDHVIVKEGYSKAVEFLGTGIDVRLNHAVSKVDWNDDNVTITCQNGEKIHADAAVCTLPLGILKKNPALFEPSLPSWKQSAISSLGYGVFNKIVMLFEDVFWENSHFFGYSSESRGNFYLFANLEPPMKKPILVALCAGRCAKWMETATDDEVITSVMRTLRKIYGRAAGKSPQSYTISRWGSDPFSCGSYSFLAPATTGALYKEMAAPVSKRLFFAGEHTNQKFPSTVHGAYMSGVREAHRISAIFAGPELTTVTTTTTTATSSLSSMSPSSSSTPPADAAAGSNNTDPKWFPGTKRRFRGRGERSGITRAQFKNANQSPTFAAVATVNGQ